MCFSALQFALGSQSYALLVISLKLHTSLTTSMMCCPGCTFGRNIAMWNAIQARHPEQAAALPKKAPVVTVQRRLRQASIRHRAAGNEAAAAASSSDYRSVPDPSLLNIVMTALLQDPRLLHTSARNSASSSRRLGMLSALPASDLSRGQSDQSADPTSLNTADVIAVLPHSQMDHPWTAHAYNPRLSSPLARLSAESILAATDAAHPRTTLMPDVSQMRRLTTS